MKPALSPDNLFKRKSIETGRDVIRNCAPGFLALKSVLPGMKVSF